MRKEKLVQNEYAVGIGRNDDTMVLAKESRRSGNDCQHPA